MSAQETDIKLGLIDIHNIKLGLEDIHKAYLGETIIFPKKTWDLHLNYDFTSSSFNYDDIKVFQKPSKQRFIQWKGGWTSETDSLYYKFGGYQNLLNDNVGDYELIVKFRLTAGAEFSFMGHENFHDDIPYIKINHNGYKTDNLNSNYTRLNNEYIIVKIVNTTKNRKLFLGSYSNKTELDNANLNNLTYIKEIENNIAILKLGNIQFAGENEIYSIDFKCKKKGTKGIIYYHDLYYYHSGDDESYYKIVIAKKEAVGGQEYTINNHNGESETYYVARDKEDIKQKIQSGYPSNKIITSKIEDFSQLLQGNFNNNISTWDTSNATNMGGMFAFTKSFNQTLDNFDTSKVTNMGSMFYGAELFNQPLDSFDTSKVINMGSMFNNAKVFNQPLDNFDTSNVTNMSSMFSSAKVFNQSLNNFNTSKVRDMGSMFNNAHAFNKGLNSFNTSNVDNMRYMFGNTYAFNQPLDSFDTSNVIDMSGMFAGTQKFNQPLKYFDTSKVMYMNYMFNGAKKFNQSLNNFNTSKVTNMMYMFYNAESFNQDISNWNVSLIKSKPFNFDKNSGFQNQTSKQPRWGQ